MVKTSAMPSYWLMKSEPSVFSIDDLARAKDGTTRWDGVRNYQARNLLRNEIAVGDGVLFYHSSADPPGRRRHGAASPAPATPIRRSSIRATATSIATACATIPRWYAVDIKFESKFAREVTLPELRGARALAEMVLLRRGSRLSVQPVTARPSGSRSSRWAPRDMTTPAPRTHGVHHVAIQVRDLARDGGVLRRRAGPARAAALAGRGRRAFDLVRPARRRLPGDRARRRRAASARRLEHRRRSASTWSRSRSSAATRDAWEAHLTAAGAPDRPPHRLHALRARPEGNRVGLSHWPDAEP